jgi:hypothetical protein
MNTRVTEEEAKAAALKLGKLFWNALQVHGGEIRIKPESMNLTPTNFDITTRWSEDRTELIISAR